MHSINDSDERAHTLRRYLNDRYANERNADIQCYVSNNHRQHMYNHYQRHLHKPLLQSVSKNCNPQSQLTHLARTSFLETIIYEILTNR